MGKFKAVKHTDPGSGLCILRRQQRSSFGLKQPIRHRCIKGFFFTSCQCFQQCLCCINKFPHPHPHTAAAAYTHTHTSLLVEHNRALDWLAPYKHIINISPGSDFSTRRSVVVSEVAPQEKRNPSLIFIFILKFHLIFRAICGHFTPSSRFTPPSKGSDGRPNLISFPKSDLFYLFIYFAPSVHIAIFFFSRTCLHIQIGSHGNNTLCICCVMEIRQKVAGFINWVIFFGLCCYLNSCWCEQHTPSSTKPVCPDIIRTYSLIGIAHSVNYFIQSV